MDGGAIVLMIIGVMFTAIMVCAVIAGRTARAMEWERTGRVTLPPLGMSARDAADRFSGGQRLLFAGDYEAAVQEFSAAITLDPGHWTAFFRRSEAYRNLGMEELANADLARADSLMGAVRQEAAEGGTSLDSGVADISGGAIIGAILGGAAGGIVGLICLWGVWFCGPVGAFLGGIIGGSIGGAIHELFFRSRVDTISRAAQVAALSAA